VKKFLIMSNMTAEEFAISSFMDVESGQSFEYAFSKLDKIQIKRAMIGFAQQEVTKALQAVIENVEIDYELANPYDANSRYSTINTDSILNAYPLENIK
jgi:ABC-type polysaccharide/polyol phosphate transport system ATPase subunit